MVEELSNEVLRLKGELTVARNAVETKKLIVEQREADIDALKRVARQQRAEYAGANRERLELYSKLAEKERRCLVRNMRSKR